MSKRTIIILIIIAALIAAVAIFSLRKEPGITDLYLNDSPASISDEEKTTEFQSTSSDIYSIIVIKDLNTEDIIEVTWSISDDDSYSIFQENTVHPEKPGSGEIIIYLLKRDDAYPEGDYKVEAVLNSTQKILADFKVIDGPVR